MDKKMERSVEMALFRDQVERMGNASRRNHANVLPPEEVAALLMAKLDDNNVRDWLKARLIQAVELVNRDLPDDMKVTCMRVDLDDNFYRLTPEDESYYLEASSEHHMVVLGSELREYRRFCYDPTWTDTDYDSQLDAAVEAYETAVAGPPPELQPIITEYQPQTTDNTWLNKELFEAMPKAKKPRRYRKPRRSMTVRKQLTRIRDAQQRGVEYVEDEDNAQGAPVPLEVLHAQLLKAPIYTAPRARRQRGSGEQKRSRAIRKLRFT